MWAIPVMPNFIHLQVEATYTPHSAWVVYRASDVARSAPTSRGMPGMGAGLDQDVDGGEVKYPKMMKHVWKYSGI